MGTAFPLFTHQMFDALGYKWANTIFGFIAVIMIPIPYVRFLLQLKILTSNDANIMLQALYFYGPSIRRRSKFSSMVMEKHG